MKWLLFFFIFFQVKSQDLLIAVSANFQDTLKQIISLYRVQYDTSFETVSGSTGKLFSQIENGAPFDLFFSADQKRPQLLIQHGLVKMENMWTYAQGQLVFVVGFDYEAGDLVTWLKTHSHSHIALANVKTAPYGLAGKQSIEYDGLYQSLKDRLIFTSSVGMVLPVIESGNAGAGFTSESSVIHFGKKTFWRIPQTHYDPLIQNVVLLNHCKKKEKALSFIEFFKTPAIQKVISDAGYLPRL